MQILMSSNLGYSLTRLFLNSTQILLREKHIDFTIECLTSVMP